MTVVDNLERGSLINLGPVARKLRFRKLDLRDINVCRRVTAGQEIVMNLAARAYGLEYSSLHHAEMLTANLVIGLNLLEASRVNAVERFLIVSSSCVYPDNPGVLAPELDIFGSLPETVNQGYGWAKRILELQGKYYSKEYGMKVAIGRPFNVYGPRDTWLPEKSHVIPALIKKLSAPGPEIVVWGSGSQKRNFIHAQDAAAALMLLTQKYPVADPVDIGASQEISIGDLVLKLMQVMGVKKTIRFDISRLEGSLNKNADTSKFNKITGGLSQTVSLEEGLSDTVAWYKDSKII